MTEIEQKALDYAVGITSEESMQKKLIEAYKKGISDYIVYSDEIAVSGDLLKKRKLFGSEIGEFKDKYPREMLLDFYDYWREPNKSKTKMKWQLEGTWSLSGRLKRWASNNFKSFNKVEDNQVTPKKYRST